MKNISYFEYISVHSKQNSKEIKRKVGRIGKAFIDSLKFFTCLSDKIIEN